jgi:hypothetical protein
MSIDVDEPGLDGYELHYDDEGYLETAVLDVGFELDGEAYDASVAFVPYRKNGEARVRVRTVQRVERGASSTETGSVPRILAVAVAEGLLRGRLGESVTLESAAETAGETYERDDLEPDSDESDMIGDHDVGRGGVPELDSTEVEMPSSHGIDPEDDEEPEGDEVDDFGGHSHDSRDDE